MAVCKVDRFMVQALLERLVREKLSEMIDVQNMEGQVRQFLFFFSVLIVCIATLFHVSCVCGFCFFF